MTKAYLLTIRCVTAESVGFEPKKGAVWLGHDYTMCTLDMDKTVGMGRLEDVLAVPSPVCIRVPEWRALTDRDYNPPQGVGTGG